jgi:hypothetical protein
LIPKRLELDGLVSLTDETGMLQHKKFSIIDREKGYTTDDNARALITALLYNKIYSEQASLDLAYVYLSFLLHMQRRDGQFHNLLGFDRIFQDDVGSDDSMGRALWACGYAVSAGVPEDMKRVAKEVFDRGLPSSHVFTSPRSWAFTILGLGNYQKQFPEDLNVQSNIDVFARRLLENFKNESDAEWRWFESYLTYSNARLSQAMFAAYESTRNNDYLDVAIDSLNFLNHVQREQDTFMPIGTNGWYHKNGGKAIYDQQPIEASCMIEANLHAFNLTGKETYRQNALIDFQWYHGRNVKHKPLFNQDSSTCYDGITSEGINRNQGAESTVSYYTAFLIMKEKKLI